MRKLSILVVLQRLALVLPLLVFAKSALADSILITGGSAGASQSGGSWDTGGQLTGENTAFLVGNSRFPVDLLKTGFSFFHAHAVGTIDGIQFNSPPAPPPFPPGFPEPENLKMWFLHAAVPQEIFDSCCLVPPPGPHPPPIPFSAPFVMNGTLSAKYLGTGDIVEFGLHGVGTLNVVWSPSPFPSVWPEMGVRYEFAELSTMTLPVPEASSLVLLFVAMVPLTLLLRKVKGGCCVTHR